MSVYDCIDVEDFRTKKKKKRTSNRHTKRKSALSEFPLPRLLNSFTIRLTCSKHVVFTTPPSFDVIAFGKRKLRGV